jgi:ubiquinone/menaquinone biosynthesis C-methylase UbiE
MMNRFFPPDYYNQRRDKIAEFVVKLFYQREIRKITKYKKCGKILDLGCGSGDFLILFRQRGWEIYGVDTSENAYRLAKNKLKQNVFNSELRACQFPDCYFDVITLKHVLEHLYDPSRELAEVFRILKDDGILFLSMPNIDSLQFMVFKEKWFAIDCPRHLFHYSPRTVTTLLEKNNFKVLEITYPLFDSPMDLFHSLKMKYFDNRAKLLKAIFSPTLLVISIVARLFPVMRGSMEVISQKACLRS